MTTVTPFFSFVPTATVKSASIFDEASYVPKTDDDVYDFTFNGKLVSAIPSKTSNFDVFCMTNSDLTIDQAETIWQYYKDLFISAKLRMCSLSRFRVLLEKIVNEKSLRDSDPDAQRNPWNINSKLSKTSASRKDEIISIINVCKWLVLQYKVDMLQETQCKSTNKDQLHKLVQLINHSGHSNTTYSYFNDYSPPDVATIPEQILSLKNEFSYRHKNSYYFICNSIHGSVILDLPVSGSSVYPITKKLLNSGIPVIINNAFVKDNIDGTYSYIKVRDWYIPDDLINTIAQ